LTDKAQEYSYSRSQSKSSLRGRSVQSYGCIPLATRQERVDKYEFSQKAVELDFLAGKSATDVNARPDTWKNFYGRLREIKEYHRTYTPANATIEYRAPKYIAERCFLPPRQERKLI
jgi:hypothetical protein